MVFIFFVLSLTIENLALGWQCFLQADIWVPLSWILGKDFLLLGGMLSNMCKAPK